MIKADTIKLIAENPAAHGVFDTITETEREVFCTIQSVGRTEYYKAMSEGLEPEYIFIINDYSDYSGEKLLKYNGVRYRVIRSFVNGMHCELTAQREVIE